jgi:hypothetical protein
VRALIVLLSLVPLAGLSEEQARSSELMGQLGSRSALLVLHATQRDDGGWHLTGEYLVLPTLVRRFLEGERGPELGVTVLREGASAIAFGRAPTGELRGTWRDGVFRGTRLGPGGQERERFRFTEAFPSMERYSADVDCDAGDARYASSLRFAIAQGRLASQSLAWHSRLAADGHRCSVSASAQQPMEGGLRFSDGACAVTLRQVGESVRVAAENCTSHCASGAYLEPLLVDARGSCRLLRPETR